METEHSKYDEQKAMEYLNRVWCFTHGDHAGLCLWYDRECQQGKDPRR